MINLSAVFDRRTGQYDLRTTGTEVYGSIYVPQSSKLNKRLAY